MYSSNTNKQSYVFSKHMCDRETVLSDFRRMILSVLKTHFRELLALGIFLIIKIQTQILGNKYEKYIRGNSKPYMNKNVSKAI